MWIFNFDGRSIIFILLLGGLRFVFARKRVMSTEQTHQKRLSKIPTASVCVRFIICLEKYCAHAGARSWLYHS